MKGWTSKTGYNLSCHTAFILVFPTSKPYTRSKNYETQYPRPQNNETQPNRVFKILYHSRLMLRPIINPRELLFPRHFLPLKSQTTIQPTKISFRL